MKKEAKEERCTAVLRVFGPDGGNATEKALKETGCLKDGSMTAVLPYTAASETARMTSGRDAAVMTLAGLPEPTMSELTERLPGMTAVLCWAAFWPNDGKRERKGMAYVIPCRAEWKDGRQTYYCFGKGTGKWAKKDRLGEAASAALKDAAGLMPGDAEG